MTIYCPLSEALGIEPGEISILDIDSGNHEYYDENGNHIPPWNKGLTLSDEHRKALSKSHMGHTPWNKGKTYKTGKPTWSSGLTKETNETVKLLNEKSAKSRKGQIRGPYKGKIEYCRPRSCWIKENGP